jgi:hypothetical protein
MWCYVMVFTIHHQRINKINTDILKRTSKHLHIQLNKTGKGESNDILQNIIFQCLILRLLKNGYNEQFVKASHMKYQQNL